MTIVEAPPPEVSIPPDYLKYYDTQVNIGGTLPEYVPGKLTVGTTIWIIVTELLNNCVENRLPGSKDHATEITVTFEKGRVTVEDNFIYNNPEQILKGILDIRDSGKPKTTKPPEDGFPAGGLGICTSTKRLRELCGNLDYHTKNGTIVAIATWKED